MRSVKPRVRWVARVRRCVRRAGGPRGEKKGSTVNSSWLYCYDFAGNLTGQGIANGCPGGSTYTINDAQQIPSKNGSSTNWSYDKAGNETAGASTPEDKRVPTS